MTGWVGDVSLLVEDYVPKVLELWTEEVKLVGDPIIPR